MKAKFIVILLIILLLLIFFQNSNIVNRIKEDKENNENIDINEVDDVIVDKIETISINTEYGIKFEYPSYWSLEETSDPSFPKIYKINFEEFQVKVALRQQNTEPTKYEFQDYSPEDYKLIENLDFSFYVPVIKDVIDFGPFNSKDIRFKADDSNYFSELSIGNNNNLRLQIAYTEVISEPKEITNHQVFEDIDFIINSLQRI
jgi:hypothetical protein